jgi:hypothetical protein
LQIKGLDKARAQRFSQLSKKTRRVDEKDHAVQKEKREEENLFMEFQKKKLCEEDI